MHVVRAPMRLLEDLPVTGCRRRYGRQRRGNEVIVRGDVEPSSHALRVIPWLRSF